LSGSQLIVDSGHRRRTDRQSAGRVYQGGSGCMDGQFVNALRSGSLVRRHRQSNEKCVVALGRCRLGRCCRTNGGARSLTSALNVTASRSSRFMRIAVAPTSALASVSAGLGRRRSVFHFRTETSGHPTGPSRTDCFAIDHRALPATLVFAVRQAQLRASPAP